MGEGGRRDLKGEDDDLALTGPLQARVAVGLETREAREGRERDLLLGRVLRSVSMDPSTILMPKCTH
jgi:hypothetical protein